jgi:hypothetical protein
MISQGSALFLMSIAALFVPCTSLADASADDKGPIINEVQVEDITSDDPSKLDELINAEQEEKRKKEYSVCHGLSFHIPICVASFTG